MDRPPERYSTVAAQQALAARLGLPWSREMQDWEYEAVGSADFDACLACYGSGACDEDERFSLMMILVQFANDALAAGLAARWEAVVPWLRVHWPVHASTVYDWALLGEASDESEDPANWFPVTSRMRSLWAAMEPPPPPPSGRH